MSEGKLGTEEKGLDIKQTYELTYSVEAGKSRNYLKNQKRSTIFTLIYI